MCHILFMCLILLFVSIEVELNTHWIFESYFYCECMPQSTILKISCFQKIFSILSLGDFRTQCAQMKKGTSFFAIKVLLCKWIGHLFFYTHIYRLSRAKIKNLSIEDLNSIVLAREKRETPTTDDSWERSTYTKTISHIVFLLGHISFRCVL
jgi:hypothetical protein